VNAGRDRNRRMRQCAKNKTKSAGAKEKKNPSNSSRRPEQRGRLCWTSHQSEYAREKTTPWLKKKKKLEKTDKRREGKES